MAQKQNLIKVLRYKAQQRIDAIIKKDNDKRAALSKQYKDEHAKVVDLINTFKQRGKPKSYHILRVNNIEIKCSIQLDGMYSDEQPTKKLQEIVDEYNTISGKSGLQNPEIQQLRQKEKEIEMKLLLHGATPELVRLLEEF